MINNRAYYSASIDTFLEQSQNEILGEINHNNDFSEVRLQQINTWEKEISILKHELIGLDGRIIFEYTIPRMGRRVDVIVITKNIVFLLEFKCGDTEYRQAAYDQVYDYALDLKNFQKESHDKLLVPILIATNAPSFNLCIEDDEKITSPIKCNQHNIRKAIDLICDTYNCEAPFDYI